jgi:protein TonB
MRLTRLIAIGLSLFLTGAAPLAAWQDPPPPPPPPTQGPVRVGGQIQAPARIKLVDPVYPSEAKANGVQGVVIIEALIAKDGSVASAKVLKSVPLLDDAAADAVRQWKYVVTYVDGQPVEVLMTVTVNFTLK